MSDYSVDPGATIERLIAERDAALALIKTHEDAMAHVLERENVFQQRLTAADERADLLEGLIANAYETAAKWVEKRSDDYVNEHGSHDPETGSIELPGTGEEYVGELLDIADGLRALKPADGGGDEQ